MDYKGNYFKDDEEKPHIVRKIFKIGLYSLSALVYILFFIVFFRTCDPAMMKQMIFSAEARKTAEQNPDDFPVYLVNTREFMNKDGSVQLKNIYYAEKVSELEIGVKFNARKLTGGKTENAFVYVLKDGDKNYYPLVNKQSEPKSNYGHERISFGNIDFAFEYNITFDNKADTGKCPVYTLLIYRIEEFMKIAPQYAEDGKTFDNFEKLEKEITPIVSLPVYDGKTVVSEKAYKK